MSRAEFAVRTFFAAGIVAILGGSLFLMWWARSVFLLLFAGIVFEAFLQGSSDWVHRRTKLSYKWSLALVVVLLLAVLGLTGWLLGAQIASQFSQLAATLPDSVQQFEDQIEKYPWGDWLVDKAQDGTALPGRERIISQVSGMVNGLVAGVTGAVVIAFVGLYGAVEPRSYRKGILHLVPKRHRERGSQVLDALDLSLRNWLIARIISMLIIGVLTSLGLWFLGVPMYLALGVLAFFLVAIPNLGPVLSAVPAILVAWTAGGQSLAGQTVALYLVIQTIESYLLLPLLQEETVYLPPILSVIGVVFFGVIGGILGALVAAPLMVVLMVLIQMLYVEDVLDDHSVKSLVSEK